MASIVDIVEATKILADNPDNVMGGSGSKTEENGNRVSDVKKDEDGSFADRVVVETQTGVESSFDSSSGLVDKEKEENGVLSSASNGGPSFPINMNDVVGADEKIKKDGEDYSTKFPVNMNDVVGGYEKNKKDGEDGGESFPVNMNDVFGGDEEIKKDGEDACTDNGEIEKNCLEANVDANGKEQGTNGDVFRVGDFVWGKIKSYPWWPGQIYDSKDASEFAVKHSQEGRLLVAYFGDGSCSWCLPSQLVPFVENFKQMSTDSSSNSFLNAIQSAVNDIGRLVEYNMTCKCVPLDKRDGLARPVVSNVGIEKGVLVPDVDVRRLSVPKYGPAGILEKLMNYAKAVNIDCLLQLAVLRSWLSAFYRAKRGYRLSVYCEPVYIEGLEDKNNKTVTALAVDFSVPIEVPILGPREDYYVLSLPAVKPHASSDDKIYHRRKQKSVAELMGENNSMKPKSQKRAEVKEEKNVGKSASSGKRRKSDDGEMEGSSKGKTGRKRKIEVTTEKVSNAQKSVDGVKKDSLSGKTKEIEVAEKTCGEAKEELEKISSPRERKRSKYLSPPYTNPVWSMGNAGSKMKSESDKSESDRASDEELPIVHLKVLDTSAQTVENDKKLTFSASDVDVQVNELLTEVQFAAVDPLYLSNKGSLDMVWAFVSALRSSTYLDGPNYKIYHKSKTGRNKRKSLKNQENDVAQEKAKSADDTKTPKAVKTEGKKADKSKSKKPSEFSRGKNSVDKLEGSASACLILTFTPEFPLPSKEEIVRLFGKFGNLNEKETNVLTESRSVRIVYTKESDAEAAFESSVSERPFGVENVNYWLQHSSAGSKSRPKFSLRACENFNLGSSQQTDDFMSDARVIREKLEIMTAILENYHSKFSTGEKSSLRDEMKHLMENVETVSEKVRVMAEKTTS